MDTGLSALLEQVTHDGFLAGTAVLTTLTVVTLGLAVRRILPAQRAGRDPARTAWRDGGERLHGGEHSRGRSRSHAVPTGSYRAPHWQDAVLLSLPGRWVGARTRRWIGRLPLTLALLLFAVLALRLRNGASVDEALAVNAGRDVVAHWVTGAAVTVPVDSLPGSPFAYPVLAAALDSVGGLFLVRAFALGCVVLATVLLQTATAARFPHRAGVLAAWVFALTGPVVFLAGLGTSDALVLAMLAAALGLGAAHSGTPIRAGRRCAPGAGPGRGPRRRRPRAVRPRRRAS